MTNEEREGAINFFKEVAEREVNNAKYSKLAIEALEQQPCEDCISRDCDKCAYYDDGSNHEACDECFADEYEHPNFKPKAQHCDDCISRQAVMDVLGDSINDDKDYHRAVVLLNNLPPVTPKEKTGWIPVSERLPEKGKQVLCCNKQGSVFTSTVTYIGKYYDRNTYVCFGQHCNVIAWMPLPEPYIEEQENE